MSIKELIKKLENLASENPESEVKFQSVDMASNWFTENDQYLIDLRHAAASEIVLTFAPCETVRDDYKKFADRQQENTK